MTVLFQGQRSGNAREKMDSKINMVGDGYSEPSARYRYRGIAFLQISEHGFHTWEMNAIVSLPFDHDLGFAQITLELTP
ncbi:hypothetical protein E5288_WYG014522 [Bos mutus]|uniref:Uncharacterized protein n=1 Tax=Bos mutus TaxID=72004 RepID=A0A6B0R3S1_9CETA|nr:hypothetical protein [Bos mutus]